MQLSTHTYDDIISLENLLLAWEEFLRGKKKKAGVQEFQFQLFDHILDLHTDLKNKTYVHGGYRAFNISDPKPRNIHKAVVRDRLLHHAIYRILYPFFDRQFIADSYSCRIGRGTHKAMDQFRAFERKESKNNTRTVWVLKCDIKKFFASVDHGALFSILEKYISDQNILWLLRKVIESFETAPGKACPPSRRGLPLGNLTSQLLVNVYMNEFDHYVKKRLRIRYYIRYADDFVFLSHDRSRLEAILQSSENFLREELKLTLHPDKLFIKTIASGIDFLGWVQFPTHRTLRTATKKRMLRNLQAQEGKKQVLESYLGLLAHGNTQKLQQLVKRYSKS